MFKKPTLEEKSDSKRNSCLEQNKENTPAVGPVPKKKSKKSLFQAPCTSDIVSYLQFMFKEPQEKIIYIIPVCNTINITLPKKKPQLSHTCSQILPATE